MHNNKPSHETRQCNYNNLFNKQLMNFIITVGDGQRKFFKKECILRLMISDIDLNKATIVISHSLVLNRYVYIFESIFLHLVRLEVTLL